MTPTLSQDHRKTLEQGSAIAPDVITERGPYTITKAAHLDALGFAAYQHQVPGLLLPIHTTDGQVLPVVLRPDTGFWHIPPDLVVTP